MNRITQDLDVLNSLSPRYVDFINKIGSGKDRTGDEAHILFSQNCSKNFNGRLVAKDRDALIGDLISVYEKYGSWKLILLDVVTSDICKSIVLRINIEAKSFGNNTAIVILRCNSDNLIEEIIEVFSPIQSDYDFNGQT